MGGRKARKELKFNALFLQGMRHLHDSGRKRPSGLRLPGLRLSLHDCLGTNTVVGRESLKALAFDPRFDPDTIFREAFLNQEEDEEE